MKANDARGAVFREGRRESARGGQLADQNFEFVEILSSKIFPILRIESLLNL